METIMDLYVLYLIPASIFHLIVYIISLVKKNSRGKLWKYLIAVFVPPFYFVLLYWIIVDDIKKKVTTRAEDWYFEATYFSNLRDLALSIFNNIRGNKGDKTDIKNIEFHFNRREYKQVVNYVKVNVSTKDYLDENIYKNVLNFKFKF